MQEKFKKKRYAIIVLLLLVIMASLMLYRAATKTTIVDESPHIVAGYSYNVLRDYRLNPEHPPLIKMFAALPLGFQNLNFPSNNTAWQDEVNGQWTLGDAFLHWSGNNPISITFWARIGPTIITLLLGLLLFIWTRKLYGIYAGLFALTLFSFSPNFIAHGPLVATDAGAAFAFLFATYFFFKYLQKQTRKNLILAGVAFGIAQLMKFSLILLIPYFTFVAIGWVIFKHRPMKLWSLATLGRMGVYMGKLILIGLIGLITIYPMYFYTTSNYPIEKQLEDTVIILESSPFPSVANAVVWMADKPILRPYAQFFLGHLMVFQRVAGGNTVYFWGEIANNAWVQYFPAVFLLKVPLAFLIMILIAVLSIWSASYKKTKIALRVANTFWDRIKKFYKMLYDWGSEYFIELALFLFVVFYWTISVMGNLNIGLRHILPTLPFLYIILAGIFQRWIHKNEKLAGQNFFQQIKIIFSSLLKQWSKMGLVVILLLWYALSSLSVYPNSIAYFNELVGGPNNGYKYVVDSNLDWGQDLRALVRYIEINNIEKIKLDYFGGGNPAYYLGDRYEKLDAFNETQRTGWIAVSATLLQNGRGEAVRGFNSSTTHYMWLNDYEPIEKIGYSIFVYHIK